MSNNNRPLVSVLLICDRPEQMTGSGCCGKVKGDPSLTGSDRAFDETEKAQEEMALLYRTVRQLYAEEVESGQIIIITVDPRNQLYLIPKLWGDVFRYRPGWKAGLRSLFQLFSIPAVIVNGKPIHKRNQPLTPDQLSHAVAEHLPQALVRD